MAATVEQELFRFAIEESGDMAVTQTTKGFAIVGGPLDQQSFDDLPAVRAAMVETGLLDPESYDFASTYTTASWSLGDLVDFLAPAVAGGNAELSIDGFLFGMSDVVGLFPESSSDVSNFELRRFDWEIEGGSGSPGGSDDGFEALVRLGSGYFVYCYAGGDIELVPFEAVDDAQAITEFQRRYGPR
ncbi:MAG: hypothetical protein WKF83_11030 [Nocardioidaceae bacterium]